MMTSTTRAALALIALLCACVPATRVMAQPRKVDQKELIGTWTLVSMATRIPSGRLTRLFGAGDGVVVFDANDRFVQVLARPAASDAADTGPGAETAAIARGSLALFGTYKIEGDNILVFHVERSTFADWTGTDLKRGITSLTDELRWFASISRAGGTTEYVWKRQ